MDAIAEYCQELLQTYFPEEVVVQVVRQGSTLLVILNRAEEFSVDQHYACNDVYSQVWHTVCTYRDYTCDALTISCRLLGEVHPEWEVFYPLEVPQPEAQSDVLINSLNHHEEEEFAFEEIISQAEDTAFGIVPQAPPSTHLTDTVEEELTVIQSYRNSLIAQFEAEAADLADLPPEATLEISAAPKTVEVLEATPAPVDEGVELTDAEVLPQGHGIAEDGALVLSEYCFIRNKSLLRADLPQPREGVARRLLYFVDLPDGEKRRLLPTLEEFFRDPKRTAIAELPEGWRDWLGEIKNAEDEVFRSVAIWLSRYCAQPEVTATMLRRILTAAEAEETTIQEASQRAIAQVESTIIGSRGRGKTQGINVSIQRTFALPDDPTVIPRGEPFQIGAWDDPLPALGPRLWACWLSYAFLAFALMGLGMHLSGLDGMAWQSWLLVGGAICLPLVGMYCGNHALWSGLIGLGAGVRWISLGEMGREHPRCLMMIEEICQRHRLPLPKLGVVKLKTPYFLTYGIGRSHFVFAAELLTALSDEELSLLFAQGLGQSYHGALALVSFGSLIPTVARMLNSRIGELPKLLRQLGRIPVPIVGAIFMALALVLDGVNWGMQRLADGAELPLQWVLRVRHYHGDRFAAIATGNPQRLWRTLAKLAHLTVTHAPENTTLGDRSKEHLSACSQLCVIDLDGAIAFGSGYAYGAANETVGALLLWDLVNPRANLLELQRSHPLLSRRLHRLCQTPPVDEELQQQVKTQQRQISTTRLSQGLIYEWLLTYGEPLWFILALILGGAAFTHSPFPLLGVPILLSVAALSQTLGLTQQFPRFGRLSTLPITRLLGDPYASAIRGQPVQLEGILMQRGDRLFDYGSDFKMVDETGAVDLIFVPPLFAMGYPLSRVLAFVEKHKSVTLQGWFYRTPIPMVRVAKLTAEGVKPLTNRHGSRKAGIVILLTLLAIATFWVALNSSPDPAPPGIEINLETPRADPPPP